MKRKLQVGDRVAVYDSEGRWFGTVGSVLPADLYEIQPATSATQGWYVAHRKQCRRLIRRERRRIKLYCDGHGHFQKLEILDGEPWTGYIEFLEARPRKEREK